MRLFENGVGRPTNKIKKRRIMFKIILVIMIVSVVGVCGFTLYKNFFVNTLEGVEKYAVPLKDKFVVTKDSSICYTIYAPSNASNYRVQIYYKKKGDSSWGNNKFININHYDDGISSQKVCVSKQKYNQEDYRILVKWTKGADDNAYSSPIKWRPSNWKYNIFTKWAYTDFSIDWTSINNTTTPPSGNTFNNITMDFTGVNGGLVVKNSYYAKGTTIQQSTVGNDYIFANPAGTTNVKVTVKFPKEVYEFSTNSQSIGGVGKNLYKIVSLNKNGNVLSETQSEKITSATHSKTIKITTNVSQIKLIVSAPNIANQAGNTLKTIAIKIAAIPTFSMNLQGTKIDDNIYAVSKEGTYVAPVTITNNSGAQVYYKWYTYNSYNMIADNVEYEGECFVSNSTKTMNVSLKLTSSMPNRVGYMRMYTSKAACENDKKANKKNNYKTSGVSSSYYINSVIGKYQLPYTFKTNDGYLSLNYNHSELSKKIGTQEEKKCYSAALAYGVYILSNGNKITSKTSTSLSTYGAIDGKTNNSYQIWDLIKKKINAGIPVILHVHSKSSSSHWVTVYAYNTNYQAKSTMTRADVLKNIKIIDPFFNSNSYNSYKRTLWTGIASERSTCDRGIHSDFGTRTWDSRTSYLK